ncbi:Uncharacterised protein [Chlamydia trachomatis]|nr:Uncharacterised protein [Chlamydia trachomatis]
MVIEVALGVEGGHLGVGQDSCRELFGGGLTIGAGDA